MAASHALTGALLLQYMEITDKDDEKSKTKKKKLQKKWKSDQRFAKKDAETQKRQQSWMDFKKGKGSKKKVMAALISLIVLTCCQGSSEDCIKMEEMADSVQHERSLCIATEQHDHQKPAVLSICMLPPDVSYGQQQKTAMQCSCILPNGLLS